MKIIDLTGDNRGVLGFHIDRKPDGTATGRFEVSSAVGVGAPGTAVGADVPTVTELQIKFDKPESIGAFVDMLCSGGQKLAFIQMQEKVRREAMTKAEEKKASDQKKAELGERIQRMAKELSALQGEYAEL